MTKLTKKTVDKERFPTWVKMGYVFAVGFCFLWIHEHWQPGPGIETIPLWVQFGGALLLPLFMYLFLSWIAAGVIAIGLPIYFGLNPSENPNWPETTYGIIMLITALLLITALILII